MRNLEKWSFRWQSCAMVWDIFSSCFYTNKIFNVFYLSIVLNLVISLDATLDAITSAPFTRRRGAALVCVFEDFK